MEDKSADCEAYVLPGAATLAARMQQVQHLPGAVPADVARGIADALGDQELFGEGIVTRVVMTLLDHQVRWQPVAKGLVEICIADASEAVQDAAHAHLAALVERAEHGPPAGAV